MITQTSKYHEGYQNGTQTFNGRTDPKLPRGVQIRHKDSSIQRQRFLKHNNSFPQYAHKSNSIQCY